MRANLVRAYKIEAVPRQGDSEFQARARCIEAIKSSET